MRWTVSLVAVLAGAFVVVAAEPPPEKAKWTIAEVMKMAHLTPENRATRNNLDSKVIDGKATAEEKKQLLGLYQQLGQNKPPKGDVDDWKKDTAALVAAMQAVLKGEDKATEKLAQVTNCKGCHSKYRP